MGTLILFIIVLSVLVFVHEFGHFVVAKKIGMKVEEFGFGFPPRLFGIKKGETMYSINWIPLGGFVKIKGESGEFKDELDSFSSKKIWQRFLVLIAGVAMNLVLAAVLFSVGFMIGLPSVIDHTLPQSARVVDSAFTVMTVLDNSPASEADIKTEDKIVSIDGLTFSTTQAMRDYVGEEAPDGIEVIVQKSDQTPQTLKLTSRKLDDRGLIGIGIAFEQTGLVFYPPLQAIGQGFFITGKLTAAVVLAFVSILVNLFTGNGLGMDLSGPVGIAVMTGQVASMGFIYLLQFTALLSINLAVINVLPFPALDGGRLLFLIIEKFRGHRVNAKIETALHNLGFILLMVLVVLVTYRDFVNFGDEIINAMRSMI